MGVDEIHLGKQQKFLTVVSNLETGEPLWFGRERKKETLDEFFEQQLSRFQRSAMRAACVDMWEPFRQSIEQWLPQCRIVYDKFHIMQHARAAVDEVRRAEFFRKGGAAREVVKGKRWLLLSRWVHLNTHKKRQLNALFALNRRVMKAKGATRGERRADAHLIRKRRQIIDWIGQKEMAAPQGFEPRYAAPEAAVLPLNEGAANAAAASAAYFPLS